MKFLYLKGINIFGPLEAGEIAKENWFSDDLLVCPEDKAEQEAAWKPASSYEEFKNISGEANPPVKEDKQDVTNDNPAPQQDSSNQENNNISGDLPLLEDTETDFSTFSSDEFSANFNEVMGELSSQEENKDFSEDDIKDHTFRISNKEDNLLEDLPAHSLIGPEGDSIRTQEQNPADINGTIQEDNSVQGQKDFLEISNNKIISSSDGRVKKQKSNDLLFILSFLVLMVVAIALCMAFWNMVNDNKNAQQQTETAQSENFVEQEQNQEEYSASSEISNQQFAGEGSEEEINQPKTYSSEEQVINIVKNTRLSNNRGSIGDYLDRVYGENYQSSWSAKPFTDKVYIVEFFASQVRNEPYVYLFRVDMDQKKITGALNNITLDLLA